LGIASEPHGEVIEWSTRWWNICHDRDRRDAEVPRSIIIEGVAPEWPTPIAHDRLSFGTGGGRSKKMSLRPYAGAGNGRYLRIPAVHIFSAVILTGAETPAHPKPDC
jgi:hypothetical protein